jgi:hypothetical protein
VLIHWRSTPYRDKWVIARAGTETAPIVVRGVLGPGGERPVISGSAATTRIALDYWGESRSVIKIGGASIPADTMPRYIVIENLDVSGARSSNTFTDDAGASQSYAANAAAIWIEKGEHITLRNNWLHDSGNGLFVSSVESNISRDILIEENAIYDNGNIGSIYEHNVYSESLGITYQYNYFGPTKTGAGGNNLKDRSAGLVVRYNWIEGGNRQLDLVESDSATIQRDPSYRETFVYGNVLIEPAGAGNRQIVHYGGDGTLSAFRKGVLYFYNNTLVSYRTDRTTLFRLSTNEERADARNNIFYVTAAGNTLSLTDAAGTLDLTHNWFKPGHVDTFGTLSGVIIDDGTSVESASPGFVDEPRQDFRLAVLSPARNTGTWLSSAALPDHAVLFEYLEHQAMHSRANDGVLDLGAFELQDGQPADLVVATQSLPSGTVNTGYKVALAATGGIAPYVWSLAAGSLPPGLSLTPSGEIAGTPSQSGTWSFTMRVTDGQTPSDSATKALTLAVASSTPTEPLAILTSSLPGARRHKPYSRTLQATGGVPPYGWSVLTGSLPPGLTLNGTTGVISGRPTTVGTWSFIVEVRDSRPVPAKATKSLLIRVRK